MNKVKYLIFIFITVMLFTTNVRAEVYSSGGKSVMTGKIIEYASSTIPSGYLLCDGKAVSRTTYANLYKVVGTTYGSGDGSTTFNLPNFSEKILLGRSSSMKLGTSGGTSAVSININNMPAHTHSYTPVGSVTSTFNGQNVTTTSSGQHLHNLIWNYEIPSGSAASGTTYRYAILNPTIEQSGITTNTAGSHTHTFTPTGTVKTTFSGETKATVSAGSGAPLNIENAYTVVNYLIKY